MRRAGRCTTFSKSGDLLMTFFQPNLNRRVIALRRKLVSSWHASSLSKPFGFC